MYLSMLCVYNDNLSTWQFQKDIREWYGKDLTKITLYKKKLYRICGSYLKKIGKTTSNDF